MGSHTRKPVSAVPSDPGWDGRVLRPLGATSEDSGEGELSRGGGGPLSAGPAEEVGTDGAGQVVPTMTVE